MLSMSPWLLCTKNDILQIILLLVGIDCQAQKKSVGASTHYTNSIKDPNSLNHSTFQHGYKQ